MKAETLEVDQARFQPVTQPPFLSDSIKLSYQNKRLRAPEVFKISYEDGPVASYSYHKIPVTALVASMFVANALQVTFSRIYTTAQTDLGSL